MTREEAFAFALTLPGTEQASHYRAPAIKANGHAILAPGREEGSFCVMIDQDTKLMLLETDPATYWQTPHYDGWPAVLVRENSDDPERVRATIELAHARALNRKAPRKPPRKKT